MLEILPTLDPRLADPESTTDQQPEYARNELRSIKPEISVLVGLCTHLGCAPELVAEIRPQPFDPEWKGGYFRSEEHTSELQSRMRISYAVFCLQKQIHT